MKKIIYFLLLLPALVFAQAPNQYGDGTGRATGTITNQNLNPLTGVPTAGSFVRLDLANQSTLGIAVSGTYTGALSVQYTTDNGSTWVTITSTFLLSSQTSPSTKSATISSGSVGAWKANVSGLTSVRVTALAAVTGSASVVLRAVSSGEIFTFGEPLPPGANVIGAVTQSGTWTVNPGNTANTTPWLISVNKPEIVTDVASAAITTTTTTAAFTPSRGASFQIAIPVTAVTGTTPTMDAGIEETIDGTNWYRIWDFERITATGIYYSPIFPNTGQQVRYVQTIAGTTPSFTRSIVRIQSNVSNAAIKRRIMDRTITLTTLNSTTAVLKTDGASIIQLVFNVGAITTTAPALSIEGSEEITFTNPYTLPVSALTAVASTTNQTTLVGVSAPYIRAKVTTAGVGVTAGYVALKAFN